ncbi:hypothetical protein M2131_001268 [Polynucleobacter sphagniphilus]|uniref:hypothetical protein n=1 Tax=Polynucleobacter sphagniphilus TaxID=1743169 RepID=UPI002477040B|nr:hypothetical protein [Polynucleobacter sphagniphilus]MDH6421327.1 hypothetical protein [Polynucleobacter sphagniphilus]
MSNAITNRITLIGNDVVKKYVADINSKFLKEHQKKSGDTMVMAGKLFLGLKNHGENIAAFAECREIYYQNDTHWMHKQAFTLISVNGKAQKVQDLILLQAADLDEKAIVCCDYFDEYGLFYGTRYVLLANNQIKEYVIEPECKGFNFDTTRGMASFESAALKNKLAAFKLMKKENKWIDDEMFIKLKS